MIKYLDFLISSTLYGRTNRILRNINFLKNEQASMDLPPDKVKLLRQYDDEKKWDMICDQVYFLWNT